MSNLEHRGYRGTVEVSVEDECLHGRIFGVQDVVSYEAETVEGIRAAFVEAVDDYLAYCEELKQKPDKPYSGRIPLRIDEKLHREIAARALEDKRSVNAWIANTLARAVGED